MMTQCFATELAGEPQLQPRWLDPPNGDVSGPKSSSDDEQADEQMVQGRAISKIRDQRPSGSPAGSRAGGVEASSPGTRAVVGVVR